MTGPARRAAESPAPARTARAAGTAAAATALAGCGFEADDIAGLEALGLFDDVEFDALALVERLESSPFDGGVVHEYVGPVVLLQEAETLLL